MRLLGSFLFKGLWIKVKPFLYKKIICNIRLQDVGRFVRVSMYHELSITKICSAVQYIVLRNMKSIESFQSFVACPYGIWQVGLINFSFGAASALAAFLNGYLVKYIGRVAIQTGTLAIEISLLVRPSSLIRSWAMWVKIQISGFQANCNNDWFTHCLSKVASSEISEFPSQRASDAESVSISTTTNKAQQERINVL